MEPICYKILEEWAKYTDYDENRSCFKASDFSYELHRATKKIKYVIDNYDDTGMLSVIMVKELFYTILKDARLNVSLYDLLMDPTVLDDTRRMHELFNCAEFMKLENQYTGVLENLVERVIGKKLISSKETADAEPVTVRILHYTDKVIWALDKCRTEVYKCSGQTIDEIKNFSTRINVFPTLGECLLTLEAAPDGMYLCYIDVHQSPDSYFAFFLKSNGNIVALSERECEAYRGQHACGRNLRWVENKADEIFPYAAIFEYSKHDCEGYATGYKIDENGLAFFELTEDVYLPILLGMLFMTKKFVGKDLSEYDLYYTDALLKVNRERLTSDKAELMTIEKNALVKQADALDLSFDYAKLMNGEVLAEFNGVQELASENRGQIFVDMYGAGFEPKTSMNVGAYLLGTGADYVAEVVDTGVGMRAQACMDLRKQMADYIREKMFEEYQAFGGIEAVTKWFDALLQANVDKLKDFAVRAYVDVKTGKRSGICSTSNLVASGDYGVNLEEGKTVCDSDWGCTVVNRHKEYPWRFYDLDTGAVCNIKISIFSSDYTVLEKIFGVEVPKIVKGWERHSFGCCVNSNLYRHDAVEKIATPFDRYEMHMNEVYKEDGTASMQFAFTICFAKRGLQMNAKRLGYDLNNLQADAASAKSSSVVVV